MNGEALERWEGREGKVEKFFVLGFVLVCLLALFCFVLIFFKFSFGGGTAGLRGGHGGTGR